MIRSLACRTLVAISVFVGLASRTAAADEWPEFRGPAGDGTSMATGVPVEWGVKKNVRWKQRIPGSGWSSPVLAGGKIFLTTATGSVAEENVSLRALCIDAKTGHIVWDEEVFRPAAADAKIMHEKNSLASATPIVAGDRLFVHFGHMGTAALDLDRNIIWRQTDLKYSPQHGNGGSPALVDGLLVFSCDGDDQQFIAALDQKTGEVRWKTPRETEAGRTFSFCTPLVIEVDGDEQVISPGSGMAGAYDPEDGREIWRVNYGEGFSVVPRPVTAHGLVYICSGFMRANLLAVNPRGATGDATQSNVVWRHDRGVPTTPSVVICGDAVYFVSDNGVATCLDAHTGKVHWTERLGGNFSASPVCAEGRVYFLSEDGVMYVVAADPRYELLATNDLGERTLASPAVDDGALYIRTASHLWRIGR